MDKQRTKIGTVIVSDPTYEHRYQIGMANRIGLSYGRLSMVGDPDRLMVNLMMGAVAVAHWIIDENPDNVTPHTRRLAEMLAELDDLPTLVAEGSDERARMFPRPCRGPHGLDTPPFTFAEDGYCPECHEQAAEAMADMAEARDER